MKKIMFWCIICVVFSCTISRYPAKRYIRDQKGYYNWNNPLGDSCRAVYYVIVGSFPNEEEAIKFKSDLEFDNYPAIILPREEGRFRVSLGTYSFKSNAEKAQAEYKQKHQGALPWILNK